MNHRYLDLSIKTPRGFAKFEGLIRNYLSDRLDRGKIDVFVNYEENADSQYEIIYNKNIAKMYYDKIQQISNEFGIDGSISAASLSRYNEVLELQEVEIEEIEVKEISLEAQDIPLDVLYEDNDIIVINKPKGMVVHPANGNPDGTLVNAIMAICKDSLSGINGIMRPGIVHRIDKDTTGALVVCKNDYSHQMIAEQLKEHSITRRYEAIVYQAFKELEGRIEGPIGRHPSERTKMAINYKNGKDAITNYKVIENFGTNYAHVECRLETGRTHQIRVHMASIHHPLLGDTVYGPAKDSFGLEGQTLHAKILGFIHPTTKEYMEFEAPTPEYFSKLIQKLRQK